MQLGLRAGMVAVLLACYSLTDINAATHQALLFSMRTAMLQLVLQTP